MPIPPPPPELLLELLLELPPELPATRFDLEFTSVLRRLASLEDGQDCRAVFDGMNEVFGFLAPNPPDTRGYAFEQEWPWDALAGNVD